MSKILKLDEIVYAKKKITDIDDKIKTLDNMLQTLYTKLGDGKISSVVKDMEDIIITYELEKLELEKMIRNVNNIFLLKSSFKTKDYHKAGQTLHQLCDKPRAGVQG